VSLYTESVMAPPRAGTRNAAVDFYRGLGLWIIFLDHFTPNILSQFTPWRFGFSDFAEIFVFLSGYIGITSYDRAIEQGDWESALRKLARRVIRIYFAHFASFTAAVLLILLFAAYGIRVDDPILYPWLHHPGRHFLGLLIGFGYTPAIYALLPLYAVISPVLLLAAIGVRRAPKLTVALSCAIWSACQFSGFHWLLTNPQWHFNPFAWQFLFVIGGATRIYSSRVAAVARSRWTIAAAAIIVAAAAVFMVASGMPVQAGKNQLAPNRLLHFGALAILVHALTSGRRRWLESGIARLAIICGRDSLVVFAVSLMLDMAATLTLVATHGGAVMQMALSVAGLAILCSLAWSRDRLRARSQSRNRIE
jgi:hypothetical protein